LEEREVRGVSIKWRAFILLFLFSGLQLGLGWICWTRFDEWTQLRRQVDLSQSLQESAGQVEALRKLRGRVSPERRAQEVSDLIQALNAGNPRWAKERQTILLKNEREYQRYARQRMDYLEQSVRYHGSLIGLVLVLGTLSWLLLLRRAVLRPIADLSQKMVDFLHERYTYQFSVPRNDEIGHMHATFNAMAQRVLSNMEQLKTLDQAKSDFLSIASHELRTPLTSIKGSLSLMRSGVVGPMNDMSDNLLNIAEKETDRLIRLINDILDLAKIEAQKLSLQRDWRSLNQLVESCLDSLQGLAGQAEVHLACELTPPLEAYMDNDRIQQVLTNLLSNAIKFSPKGKVVTVRASINDEQQLLIEVQDQGRGIEPQDRELIFQKFRQASSNPLVKGTGLGLAIARALVEEHGGQIDVRSTPGYGSTFFFTLPEWRFTRAQRVQVAA
jgi:signal transduction histidine kinase